MNTNKNIGRALFQVEKTALLIVFMIVFINVAVNVLVVVLDDSTADSYFITQMMLNITLFGFVYLMIYGINQVVTSIPFLVSLNCPKKMLAKNVVSKGISRSLIIALIFLLLKETLYRAAYGLGSSILGINLTSGNLADTLILGGIVFAALLLVYSLVTLISLLGVSYGWEYVLTAVFIILGSGFLLARAIVLTAIFGRYLNEFVLAALLLTAGFSLVNYRLISNFEYKN